MNEKRFEFPLALHLAFMPPNKMAEGHIEFTLSVCVRACVRACMRVCVPESCPGHNLAVHDGVSK